MGMTGMLKVLRGGFEVQGSFVTCQVDLHLVHKNGGVTGR